MSQTLQLTCCKTSVKLSHCRRKKKKKKKKKKQQLYLGKHVIHLLLPQLVSLCYSTTLVFSLLYDCFCHAWERQHIQNVFFWRVVHWLITTNSRVSSTAVCTWAGYASVQADLQVSDNRGRCWNRRKVIRSVKQTKKPNNRIHFPAITFSPFLIFCFPLNCDICHRGEDYSKCWGLQSVNISSQLNLSRRMLFHSTMRKCNSLLEEKILLLYWPSPKILLNTPHCVHTHTQRQQKNNTEATGIQVANLF